MNMTNGIKDKYKNEALNIIQEKYLEIDFSSLDNDTYNDTFQVGDLVDTLGWDIEFAILPCSVYGFTTILDKKTIIFLNDKHKGAVNCFTIARQIGYYVLHGYFSDETDKDRKYIEEERKKNAEVNSFASELLMPEYQFVKVFSEHKGDFSRIASTFMVPLSICITRALNLGLISVV